MTLKKIIRHIGSAILNFCKSDFRFAITEPLNFPIKNIRWIKKKSSAILDPLKLSDINLEKIFNDFKQNHPPFWILHFEFVKSDFSFVIIDLKDPSSLIFKITQKKKIWIFLPNYSVNWGYKKTFEKNYQTLSVLLPNSYSVSPK